MSSVLARSGSAAALAVRTLRAAGVAQIRGSASAAEPATAAPVETLPNVKDGKVLHPELLNESIRKTSYAVRGELYLRAEELRREGKEIIFTNVGNPQALGQTPLTFNRQVCCPPFSERMNITPRSRSVSLMSPPRALSPTCLCDLSPRTPPPHPTHPTTHSSVRQPSQFRLCSRCQNRLPNIHSIDPSRKFPIPTSRLDGGLSVVSTRSPCSFPAAGIGRLCLWLLALTSCSTTPSSASTSRPT